MACLEGFKEKTLIHVLLALKSTPIKQKNMSLPSYSNGLNSFSFFFFQKPLQSNPCVLSVFYYISGNWRKKTKFECEMLSVQWFEIIP